MSLEDKKVAVCQGNRLRKDGGAIRVAVQIAKTFDAKLFIGFNNTEDNNEVLEGVDYEVLFDSWKSNIIRKSSKLRDIASMDWWKHNRKLYNYDIIIHSGNESNWFVPKDDQIVIHYCHAPPRVAYENFHEKGQSFITRLYTDAIRTIYLPTTKYPDKHIVPSKTVKRRMELYWNKKSTVVNPPINLSDFSPDISETKDYYLAFSRLNPQKRVLSIAKEFAEIDQDLVIGGTGEQKQEIESIASENDNINYIGYMSEEEKCRRLSESKAMIFNSVDEAFGIVPIESFASGTPLIGVNDGHIPEHIDNGNSGIIYDRGNIKRAVQEFEKSGVSYSEEEISDVAQEYSEDSFSSKIKNIVENVESEHSRG